MALLVMLTSRWIPLISKLLFWSMIKIKGNFNFDCYLLVTLSEFFFLRTPKPTTYVINYKKKIFKKQF